jgi:hypothetical protein
MNVFLSWAGEPSKQLALAFHDFLPVVVQECSPWMSKNDILAGQPWDRQLESALKAATFGVVCITPQNRENAYLHYEAGAIANQVGDQHHVCPVLLGGLTPGQLSQPLGRFQAKVADVDGIWELVVSLNSTAAKKLDPTQLRRAFDGQWPSLQQAIAAIRFDDAAPTRRPADEMLDEILQHIRIFASGSLGGVGAGFDPGPVSFKSRTAEGQARNYTGDLVARIHRNLVGRFEWHVEDVKNKTVIDFGDTATLPEAQRAAESVVGPAIPPLDEWHVMRRV